MWLFLSSNDNQSNCLSVVVFLDGTGDELGSKVEKDGIFNTRRPRYALLPMEDTELVAETNQRDIKGSDKKG